MEYVIASGVSWIVATFEIKETGSQNVHRMYQDIDATN